MCQASGPPHLVVGKSTVHRYSHQTVEPILDLKHQPSTSHVVVSRFSLSHPVPILFYPDSYSSYPLSVEDQIIPPLRARATQLVRTNHIRFPSKAPEKPFKSSFSGSKARRS